MASVSKGWLSQERTSGGLYEGRGREPEPIDADVCLSRLNTAGLNIWIRQTDGDEKFMRVELSKDESERELSTLVTLAEIPKLFGKIFVEADDASILQFFDEVLQFRKKKAR